MLKSLRHRASKSLGDHRPNIWHEVENCIKVQPVSQIESTVKASMLDLKNFFRAKLEFVYLLKTTQQSKKRSECATPKENINRIALFGFLLTVLSFWHTQYNTIYFVAYISLLVMTLCCTWLHSCCTSFIVCTAIQHSSFVELCKVRKVRQP